MDDEANTVGSTLAIHQDKFGFMWFAGKSGLTRFDGSEYVFYKHNNDLNGISNDVIWDILEDDAGNLWLATERGINRFIRKTQTFEHYLSLPHDNTSIRGNIVTFLYKDNQGKIWVGTNNGLDSFDPEQKTFTHYPTTPEEHALSGEFVLSMAQDSDGIYYLATGYGFKVWNPAERSVKTYQYNPQDSASIKNNLCRKVFISKSDEVWVGTELGLHLFDKKKETFEHIPYPDKSGKNTKRGAVWDILEDSFGELWVAGDASGISRLDRENKKLISYFNDPLKPDSIYSNESRTIFEDINGDIWIGHYPSGVSIFERYNTTFRSYRTFGEGNAKITTPSIQGIVEDKLGNLWLGTDGGGIAIQNERTGSHTTLTHDPNNPNSPTTNNIQQLFISSTGNIWYGMWNGGASKYNIETQTHTRIYEQLTLSDSVPNAHVSAIAEDEFGNILLGSMDGGLTIYNPTTEEIRFNFHNPSDSNSLSNNRIWALLRTRDNKIWIGTHNGLDVFDPKTNTYSHYKNKANDPNSLSHNWVVAIFEDSEGLIWVGTHGYGISVLNRETDTFERISESDGLANNVIYAFLEDDFGNMWLSSNRGLTRYNKQSKEIRNFTKQHGIQGYIFNRGAALKTQNGDLIFGGTQGYTRFSPAKIEYNNYHPPIVLTGLEINNERVSTLQKTLSSNLLLAEEVNLNHKQNIFTIHYAALNYRLSELNQYAYMLEGFDEDWQHSGNKKSATYTNLDPGSYTFKVKGTNNEGIWSDKIREINIHIQPAPWKTWWAYLIYSFIFFGVITGYVVSQRKIIEYQRTIVARLKKIDKVKDQFIASTSHELKTPLFGIIGLAENIIDNTNNNLQQNDLSSLSMIISSSKRLAAHVQDILDHSSMIESNTDISLKPISLYEVVNLVVTMLRPLVKNKNIHFSHSLALESATVLADSDRLQQILYNLLINAIKYTQEGSITVEETILEGQKVRIDVKDTGQGIADEELHQLFDAFFQVDEADSRKQGGTGLGLTISKNLVKLHNGEISIKSKLNEGTTVSFTLHTTNQPYEPITLSENFVTKINSHTAESENTFNQGILIDQVVSQNDIPDTQIQLGSTKNYHILVVDDEAVNRFVLNGFLETENYRISHAENGMQALDKIKNGSDIDLILLDVMMPGISGYEVCREIRRSHSSANLPILFITAKSQVSDLQEAFDSGGNDFLPKPVTRLELISRVKLHLQLLEANMNLEEKVLERTQALEEAYKKVEELSVRDALTGLYNRHFFQQFIDPVIAECNRRYTNINGNTIQTDIPLENYDITFFLIDIDNFKMVNDKFGHEAGDKILVETSKRLNREIRDSDYFIRWGGEEFLLITRNTPRTNAKLNAERILNALRKKPFELSKENLISITCSIGFCSYPPNKADCTAINYKVTIEIADKLLYLVKNNGKNGWAGLEETTNSSFSNDKLKELISLESVNHPEHTLILAPNINHLQSPPL